MRIHSGTPFDRWTRFRALAGAWERLKGRDLAPGEDRVRMSDFARNAAVEVDALCDELRTAHYAPRPLRCFTSHSGGKDREMGIPAVRDRVVQEALRPFLEQRVLARLDPHCHGYVRGRSTLTAQHDAAALVATGLSYVHGSDIADGFGSVNRGLLATGVTRLLDAATGAVVAALMAAPHARNGRIEPAPPFGIPLGQPLAPVCFNLYLLPLDAALREAGVAFVRYADDILLLASDEPGLDRALAVLDQALAGLGMTRNLAKDRRARIEGDPFAFLGRFLAPGRVLEAVDLKVPDPHPEPPVDPDDLPRPPTDRPLYLQEAGLWVHSRDGCIIIRKGNEERARIPLRDIDRIVVLGPVSFSAFLLSDCLQRGIAVHFLLTRGRPGTFGSLVRSDAEAPLRVRSQMESVGDAAFRLGMARAITFGKLRNSLWLLGRLRVSGGARRGLYGALRSLDRATSVDEVLGAEGAGAAAYFRALRACVPEEFGFTGRTRRPPRDPFNSLISFGYALLFNELHGMLVEQRLSPYLGYLHALRDNHPALASDLMEEFRAPIVDRFCLRAARLGQFRLSDFAPPRQDGAVLMVPEARRRYISAWEAFLLKPLCRSADGRPLDARRTMRRQVRRLADAILGGTGGYEPFNAAREFCGRDEESEQASATEGAR